MSCARHDDCCHDCGRRYCCQSCGGQNFQENPNEPCTCDEQEPVPVVVPTFTILERVVQSDDMPPPLHLTRSLSHMSTADIEVRKFMPLCREGDTILMNYWIADGTATLCYLVREGDVFYRTNVDNEPVRETALRNFTFNCTWHDFANDIKTEMTQKQKKQVTIRIYYIIDGAEACYQRDSAEFMEKMVKSQQSFRDSAIYEIYPGHWFQAPTLKDIEKYDYLCFYELDTVDEKLLGNLYCFTKESFEKSEAPGIIHQIQPEDL